MGLRANVLAWQWDGYPEFHRNKGNLLLHLFAVPGFDLSLVGLVASLALGLWLNAGLSAFGMVFFFLLQGIGHKQEAAPSIPFDGPLDAASRIFLEQLINFPRFVLSGGWWRAFRAG